MTKETTRWIRISKQRPCPICQKYDWCLTTEDGTAVICARIQSDKPVGNRGAGWLHRLDGVPLSPVSLPLRSNEFHKAPILRRNIVYNALLGELSLSETHKKHLEKRSLTDTQIANLAYKTLSSDCRSSVIRRLENLGVRMAGVPGFYFANGDVRLCGAPGILIPIKDTRGRIQGLQVRADSTGGGKYRWISSAGKPFGCSSGAPVHVSHPEYYSDGELWITEGALKADIAAIKMHRCILAVPGVGNWGGVIPTVLELKPSRIVVAFDMDKRTNETVKQYGKEMEQALLQLTNNVFEADWDSTYKGLDDISTSSTFSTSSAGFDMF